MNAMTKPEPGMAQRIAQAASDFQQERVGRAPKSVTVVLSADTLVITMRGALSRAEQAVAKSPEGAAVVQAFTTGTMVQVFLLSRGVAADTWTMTEPP